MQDIRNLRYEELKEIVKKTGEESYRAIQLFHWFWRKDISYFIEMYNLNFPFREYLDQNYEFKHTVISKTSSSADGTVKVLFKLYDGNYVEGVIIPSENRLTACISSQAGCKLGCRFCATGISGFIRNLETFEIADQVKLLSAVAHKKFYTKITNIVIMGMGEPLLNYENVTNAMDAITSPDGMGFSAKRITLSTVGIPEGIKKLADSKLKINLALSLHTLKPETRKYLLPVSDKYSLNELSNALKYYCRKTTQKVTIEYLLLKDVNDSISDAQELVRFCSGFSSKVNLIEFNEVQGIEFSKTGIEKVELFQNFLKKKNITTTLRSSKGKDINAACGQLALKKTKSRA